MLLINNTTSASIELKIKEGWKPDIDLGYGFIELQNGNFETLDRGEDSDSYTCEIETYGTQEYVDSIISFLQDVRDSGFEMSLSGFNLGEHIFGENINYTSAINVAIIDIDEVKHNTFKGVGLSLTFAVDDTSLLSFIGTGSFPILNCLQSKYVADTTWNYKMHKSYNQNYYASNHEYDVGYFVAEFIMDQDKMKEFREFHRTQRGGVFEINSSLIKGIDKIFGVRNESLPVNIRIMKIRESFRSINTYTVKVEIIQEKSIGVK